jgi:isocitrate/isopropylmalate dehydrogenase
MLLEHLGDRAGAARIDDAVERALAAGVATRDIGGTAGTREMGDAVLTHLR